MARIYQSRTLLDPSLLSIAEQKKQQYIQNNRDYLNKQTEAINAALKGVGQAATDWYGRSSRRNMLEDSFNNSLRDKLEIPEGTSPEEVARMEKINAWVDKKNDSLTRSWNDPDYVAAREKFIQTGDPSSMNAYKQNVLMQRIKAAELLQKQKDAAAAKELHNRVTYSELKGQYNDLLDKYYGSKTETETNSIGNKLNTLEAKAKEIGYDLGNEEDRKAVLEARKADEADKKTAELADKSKLKYSFDHRMNIENNVLPNAKTLEDKTNYKKLIKSMYDNGKLTKEDFDSLYNKIEGTVTQGEQIKKATEGAKAGASGKATTDAINTANSKANAKQYNGKKMNALQFLKIPEDERKFLTIDGMGNIKYIGG